MKIFGVLLCFLFCTTLCAQDSAVAAKKLSYFSTNQAIHFEGSAGSAFGVQTIHGVDWQGWGLGAGIGLDLYRMRSYPIFAHLRRRVPVRKFPLYLYAEGGPNFVWARRGEEITGNNAKTENGYYWDAGLQYRAPLRNKTSLVFSAGYGEKTYGEHLSFPFWCNTGNCPQITSEFAYTFRRLSLKAGFSF